jgi:ribosomal protein S24E
VELDNVWVRSINTKTGTHTTVGLAHVYKDPGKALIVEPEYIIQRNQKPERVAEAPVEAEEPEAEEPAAEEPEAEKQESEKEDA